jgi:hypothetical protein
LRKHRFNKKINLLFLFAGTLAMMVVMTKSGASLKTSAIPKRIFDPEFACNAAKESSVTKWMLALAAVLYILTAGPIFYQKKSKTF